MYIPWKILKYEYKLQGTDLCNPRNVVMNEKKTGVIIYICIYNL